MSAKLPADYARWIANAGLSIPADEPHASCGNCAMLGPEDGVNTYFHPSVRCCTYFPEILAYRVGAVLASNESDPVLAAGRSSIEQRIAAGVGVTPLGLHTPPDFALLYGSGEAVFGRSPRLSCPHLVDGAGCGIHPWRPAVCATWFCKYERGALSMAYWRSLRNLLDTIDQALSLGCALELGISGEILDLMLGCQGKIPGSELDVAVLEGRADAATQRRLWGHWAGREHEYFKAAAEWVENLSWTEIERLGGAKLQVLLAAVHWREATLANTQPPARLHLGRFELTPGENGVQVTGYSRFDPLNLPSSMLAALPRIDGLSPQQAQALLWEQTGLRVPYLTLQKLMDFGILRGDPAAADDTGYRHVPSLENDQIDVNHLN